MLCYQLIADLLREVSCFTDQRHWLWELTLLPGAALAAYSFQCDENIVCRAPFATIFRSMAEIIVNGSKGLPRHCLPIAGGAFGEDILLRASLKDIK